MLGLALCVLETQCKAYHLCPVIGIVPSKLSASLDYALNMLLKATRREEVVLINIKLPSVDEQKTSAALPENNKNFGPLLKDLYRITDRGRFKIQKYASYNIQNGYYEGCTEQEEVTDLLVFNLFGEVIPAAINFPGSWHDTKLAALCELYYPELGDEKTPPSHVIIGDSAFINNTRSTNGKIICARRTNETSGIPESQELAAIDLILQHIMPTERQSAKWGIRALKGPFKRLKGTLTTDVERRSIIIELSVRLLTYRTRAMGFIK